MISKNLHRKWCNGKKNKCERASVKKRKFKKSGRFFVYILKCSDGTFYTGYTLDLEKRLFLHNEGKGAKYTRGRGPVKLLWSKDYRLAQSAMRAENVIKKLTRAQKKLLVKG